MHVYVKCSMMPTCWQVKCHHLLQESLFIIHIPKWHIILNILMYRCMSTWNVLYNISTYIHTNILLQSVFFPSFYTELSKDPWGIPVTKATTAVVILFKRNRYPALFLNQSNFVTTWCWLDLFLFYIFVQIA